MRTTTFCLLSFITTLGLGCKPQTSSDASQSATINHTEIAEGVSHTGGTPLKVDAYGLTFTVPSGWTGTLQGEVFLLDQDAGEGLILLTAGEATQSEGVQQAAQSIPLEGSISAIPTTSPRVDGDTIYVDYDIRGGTLADRAGDPNDWDGLGTFTFGDYGFGTLSLGLAPAEALSSVEEAMGDLSDSLQLRQPTSPQTTDEGDAGGWAEDLAGYKITYFYSGSDYYEQESFTLCSDGSVLRVFDASGAYTERNGTWAAYGPATSGTLEVNLENGDSQAFELTRDADGGLYLDGSRFYQEWDGC